MEFSLLIIFYYGLLHALGADHLSAIALFSIGKKKREALSLSVLFAIGHGITLYLFALFVGRIANERFLAYGDTISTLVILFMGLYLVYLAVTNRLRIDNHCHPPKHSHEEKSKTHKHTHIYYQNAHLHDKSILVSLGLLMGVGGIRGMLVTLSVVAHGHVGVEMILAFIAGVSLVFLLFGYLIYLINERYIISGNALRYAMMSVGVVSVGIGLYNLPATFDVL